MKRIALGLEYDGSHSLGWQSQRGGHTLQDALESALAHINGHPSSVVCAGRTDTGVHALHQVVHFETNAIRPLSAWVRGVNSFLPNSLSVLWAKEVPADFHARFSARGRRYRYILLNRPQRPGLLSGKVGWYHRPLDLAAMQAAATLLLGEHDFSVFRAAQCQANSPVKTMLLAKVSQQGEYFYFDFVASAFLHHMIRNLVGTLVYIGSGREPASWINALLEMRDRRFAAPTFAPDGLYFLGPAYEEHWQLPGLTESSLLSDNPFPSLQLLP
jgi:tRNA pseudouridine38-40 synthase